ncbi:MAG TPA: DNA-formamidopyrimidine glycosylase family protein [Vicinamibacterales bacterium]|jgi:endonuclease-8
MPEGDTILRTARTLHRALAGHVVIRFESVYPQLTRVDRDTPLEGRIVERVEARGKHVLIWFGEGKGRLKAAPALALRTHMRMHGSWHIYRPGERWQRPRHEMRIVIETDAMHAIAFGVPDAELASADVIERISALGCMGPDVLADDFDAAEAVRRIAARPEMSIAEALLDQSAMAGIGNVYKSEVLFAAGVHPLTSVSALSNTRIATVVAIAVKMMRANVAERPSRVMASRSTTGRMDPDARVWVYGRGGAPCRRCGTAIARAMHGAIPRVTYWCDRCQRVEGIDPALT